MSYFAILALVAGACIAIQAAMNAELGQILQSSLLATCIAFATSFFLMLILIALIAPERLLLSYQTIKQVPWYLWFSGVFSVIGVGSFYYLIPKMGVGNMMSFALTGQLVFAVVISHFAWFNSPLQSISLYKIIGALLLILGVVLINMPNGKTNAPLVVTKET
ncbi:DMT family transporter [Catenovulum sp. SM1970]|uniref:DMT family transporter n=1 Tax=Marinifaba aquimaris TaxID=2741323 RepID=UPI001574D74A|nr:DMT family transporter [Marinifaba aquimaris]NTS78824.1 DMT family transporter [Marinifaba aquimaris]